MIEIMREAVKRAAIEEREGPKTLTMMMTNHGLTKPITWQETLEIKSLDTSQMILLTKLGTTLMKLKRKLQDIFQKMLLKGQNTMPNKPEIT